MKEYYLKELNFFLDYLKNEGYSESTINGYSFGLKDFFSYLKNNKVNLSEFKNQDIFNFKKTLTNKNSAQTINTKIYAVKRYVEYLNKKNGKKINWDINIIKVKSKKDLIPVKNINKLLNCINKKTKNSVISKRDTLIIKMLYYTGIRTKELVKIKNGDIINNILRLENKKIILNKCLVVDIDSYIDDANIKDSEFIFFNYSPAYSVRKKIERNKPLTEKSVQDIFNKYKSAINSKLSIIDLRNSYTRNLKRDYIELKFDKINTHNIIYTKEDYLKS